MFDISSICSCPPDINAVSVMFDISTILTVVYNCFFLSSIPYHIVRHIIHDHPSLCLYFPELNILSLLFNTWSMIIIVRHIIYDHHRLWVCLPELHTMSLLFDISSISFLFYVCVFGSSSVCPCCSTFHLWSPLLMFMSSRGNITSLMFDVSSIIIAIHAYVFQRSNTVSICLS